MSRGPVPPDLRLIVVTDSALAGPRGLDSVVAEALDGGATCVQLREKERPAGDTLAMAHRLRALTRARGRLFVVNDRLDIALAVDADGVHLGPDDLPVDDARRHSPPGFLIGYSADDPAEAGQAQVAGADYIGCGTVWPTPSKPDAGPAIGPDALARVAGAVSIPVVAIGGITSQRIPALAGTGLSGVAVIGAVMGSDDPRGAAQALLRSVEATGARASDRDRPPS